MSLPKGADLCVDDHVRLCAPLWRGVVGVVAYVGADRVEVLLPDGSVLPFLAAEVEPRDQLKPVEVRYV